MVRRVQQACCWSILAGKKGAAEYCELLHTQALIGAHAQIFIDEIDSLFRERSAGDHEVTGMMKAEFMT